MNSKMCHSKKVVYEIKCQICQAQYIGSTAQPLHERIAQHFQASSKSAIVAHTESCNPQQLYKISIISHHRKTIDSRLAEAITIRRKQLEGNHLMNRRHELDDVLSFTNLYLPPPSLNAVPHIS